jgi:radical SAM protein with 4Fe4S-binding SPASM domain
MSNIGHNFLTLNPKKRIQQNILRKTPILDREPQIYKGVPLPSWIELSLIDVCNRSCSFCPKSDESIAPNTHQKMERVLIDKLYKNLKDINYEGAFTLCGYGEPLLYKDLEYLTNKLGEIGSIEIVTNGDPLNAKILQKLYKSKISQLVISMYDGPEQVMYFTDMMKEANVPETFCSLRDRWYKGDEFAEYITNRAGTVQSGKQIKPEDVKDKRCFYPTYHAQIDWDGNLYVCPHDWQRRNPVGNLMQKDFFEIWNGTALTNIRKMLFAGIRDKLPCESCNCNGKVHGEKHYEAFKKNFNK